MRSSQTDPSAEAPRGPPEALRSPAGGGFLASSSWSKSHQELVEDRAEPVEKLGQGPAGVEQVGDSAEQVAEQLAGPRLGHDVQDDAVEVYLEAEQIKVEGPQDQVKDVACGSSCPGDWGRCAWHGAVHRLDL